MGVQSDTASPPSLLIVDSLATNIQVFAQALQGDYQLYFAMDGEQAMQTATAHSVDVVLLDDTLPDRDSLDVLADLRRHRATASSPVILVASTVDDAMIERALELGAADVITKPAHPALTRARVATQLRLRRQSQLIEEHAYVDELTELGNRRRFDDALSLRWRAGMRSNRPVGLLLIDLDDLTAFEDRFGAYAANRALRNAGKRLATLFRRPEDTVARIEHGRFAVVTHVEENEDVVTLLQRALDGLHELRMPHEASPRAVRQTVSIGFVRVMPSPDYEIERLEEAAERLLQQATMQGGGRCCFRDDLERTADFLLATA